MRIFRFRRRRRLRAPSLPHRQSVRDRSNSIKDAGGLQRKNDVGRPRPACAGSDLGDETRGSVAPACLAAPTRRHGEGRIVSSRPLRASGPRRRSYETKSAMGQRCTPRPVSRRSHAASRTPNATTSSSVGLIALSQLRCLKCVGFEIAGTRGRRIGRDCRLHFRSIQGWHFWPPQESPFQPHRREATMQGSPTATTMLQISPARIARVLFTPLRGELRQTQLTLAKDELHRGDELRAR